MPYITPERRIEMMIGSESACAGDLTYQLTMICNLYLAELPKFDFNRGIAVVVGALEHVKMAVMSSTDHILAVPQKPLHKELWYAVLSYNHADAVEHIIAAFECAKLEFYRRMAAPYEDTKIVQNGDCYPVAPRAVPDADSASVDMKIPASTITP